MVTEQLHQILAYLNNNFGKEKEHEANHDLFHDRGSRCVLWVL